MRPQGHIAAGLPLGMLAAGLCTDDREALWAAGGALAANLPDVDVALTVTRLLLRRAPVFGPDHHGWPTHTPAFWGALCSGGYALASAYDSERGRRGTTLAATGIAVHLLQDTLSDGLPLLWPLTSRRFGLHLDAISTEPDWKNWYANYSMTTAGKLEWNLILLASTFLGWRLCRRLSRRFGRQLFSLASVSGGVADVEVSVAVENAGTITDAPESAVANTPAGAVPHTFSLDLLPTPETPARPLALAA